VTILGKILFNFRLEICANIYIIEINTNLTSSKLPGFFDHPFTFVGWLCERGDDAALQQIVWGSLMPILYDRCGGQNRKFFLSGVKGVGNR
jgi:hypothetical protein